MITPFIYEGLPARVIFGCGTLPQVRDEVALLGCKRLLVLSTLHQSREAERVAATLGQAHVASFTEAAMHTPTEVTDRAVAVAQNSMADGIVSIGGGSTIGLGKAIALRTDLPQVVLPTTYAGSEMTPIIGETTNGVKTTRRTRKVLPKTVIYDVELTLSLPPKLSVVSGLNAMAHAVEALYATNTNPVISLMAENGIRALYRGLPVVTHAPTDLAARGDILFGAWLCAICLGAADIALHHKLCHVLGGSFELPHAETHAILLPHALAYNAPAARPAVEAIKRAMGGDGIAGRIYDIAETAGVPVALRDIGMPEESIERAVQIALEKPYPNPRPVEPHLLHRLLSNAWRGVRPDHSTYAS